MRVRQSSVFIGNALLIFFSMARGAAAVELEDGSQYLGKPVRSIQLEADQPLDRSHYDPLLRLKPGDLLTRSSIKDAIQNLHRTGDFADISVLGEMEGDGVRLTFRLRLNFYFNEFIVRGETPLRGRDPSAVISLPIGERFSGERLEEVIQSVRSYLRERGYFQARVDASTERNPKNRQADVILQVETGERARISSATIEGVPTAEAAWIRGKLKIEKGSHFDREALRRRIESLRQDFLKRGYLEATAAVVDSFDEQTNSVRLAVSVASYGRVRVALRGYDVPRDQWRRLLPILSGGGGDPELLREGVVNLKHYLEERGYPAADVSVSEKKDPDGIRTIEYSIDSGERVTVADVRFKGNTVFTPTDLQAAIQIAPSRLFRKSTYSRARIDSDIDLLRSLYGTAGYLDAEILPLIEPLNGAERIRVTFEINEGAKSLVQELTFDGNSTLSSDALLSTLSLRPGQGYSPSRAERDRQTLLAEYNNAGFTQPKVAYQATEVEPKKNYKVRFTIEEGPRSLVDDVIVLGNRRTRDSMVRSRVKIRKDEPLSLGKMLETQQALYNTGMFERVRVSPQNPESTAPYQDVVVRLDESRQITTGYSVGYKERDGVSGTFEIGHLNFFGSGRSANLRIRGSRREKGVALSLQQPRLIPIPLDSHFTLSAQDKKQVSFDARRVNVSLQFADPINDHSWLLLRYGFRNVRVSNLKISPSELGRDDVERNLSTVSAIYVNDTRDNFLDPETGFFSSTDFSVTTKALGGNNNYISLYTQNSYHRKFVQPFLLSAALQFGVARPYSGDTSLPLSERFFAGGASSLRGLETDLAGPLDAQTNQPVGGNAVLIANLELKLPLLRYLQLAGFYDTGNVFRNLGDIRLADFSHAVGVGLRLKTPFGPIRLDYGFNLNFPDRLRAQGISPRQFFVTIGPPF